MVAEREINRLIPLWNARYEFIYQTPSAGLAGAVGELRPLADEAMGFLGSYLDEAEGEPLRDISRVVEREMKAQAK